MKRITLLAAALATLVTVSAQGLSLQSQSQLRKHRLELNAGNSRSKLKALRAPGASEEDVLPSVTLAFASIADGFSRSDLEDAGLEVLSCRGGIAIIQLAYDDVEDVAALHCIRTLELQKPVQPAMDRAREATGIDLIHQGSEEIGLSVPYTGRGVVTAIVDQGIDPHHINFRLNDPTNPNRRFEYLAHLRVNAAGTGIDESHYNYTNIASFSTDTPTAYHGTHTLGIMAGAYDGPVQVAEPLGENASGPAKLITESCKYYGVAPASFIAAACGDLQDAIIGQDIEALLNFGYWMRNEGIKDNGVPIPMVLNLSIGSNGGSKDPNAMMVRYLTEAGKEAIICISAGNEGDLKLAVKKTFTEDDKTLKTLIFPYYMQYDPENPDSYTLRQGAVSVYSNDKTPFKLKAVIYNRSRNWRAAKYMPVVGDNIGTYYVSEDKYKLTDEDIVGDGTFCRAFEGSVGVGGMLDQELNRYYGMVDYAIVNNMVTNLDDNYVLGFEVEGVPGQTIECYCDGGTTWLDNYGVEGFEDGSCDGTISDLAVGDNVLAVGSYNTRQSWVCLDGGVSRYEGDGFIEGHISGFSSFATMSDGRVLPHICAPGAAIISSVSWPYVQRLQAAGMTDEYLNIMVQAKLEEENRTNYWKQEVGTSMSTPFVSGTIALWLEANPYLTIADVKEIVAKTAIRDEAVNGTKEIARWGAGKFNPIGGLKEAIRLAAGVGDIEVSGHNDRLILTRQGGRLFRAFVGGQSRMDARIFNLSGVQVFGATADGDEIDLDLSSLPAGIYILNVNGRHSERIALGAE